MTTSEKRSLALKIAHSLVSQDGYDFGTAQIEAWDMIRLKIQMKEGQVGITFENKEGEEQARIGTLNAQYLPAPNPNRKPSTKKKNYAVFTYFDLDRDAFRSFRIARLKAYQIAS